MCVCVCVGGELSRKSARSGGHAVDHPSGNSLPTVLRPAETEAMVSPLRPCESACKMLKYRHKYNFITIITIVIIAKIS